MKRAWLTAGVVLFWAVSAAGAGEDAGTLIGKAREEADPKAGIALYSKALKLDPGSAAAYYERAKLYKQLEQYEKAIEDLNQYIALEPDEFSGYYAKDRVYVKMKNFDMATGTISSYIGRFPDDPKGYFERGYINRYFDKRLEQSIRDFSEVIRLSPEDSTAYIERGLTYQGLGDYKKAVEDFSQALSFKPDDAIALRERGRCYKEMKEFEKAVQDFQKSIQYNPDYAWTYYYLASIYYGEKKAAEALEFTSRAAQLESSDVIHDLRANILRDMGLTEKAMEEADKAFSLGGRHYYTRASIYFLKGERKKAYEDIMESFRIDEESDQEPQSLVIAERVPGFADLVKEVKDKYFELKKKYGTAAPVE